MTPPDGTVARGAEDQTAGMRLWSLRRHFLLPRLPRLPHRVVAWPRLLDHSPTEVDPSSPPSTTPALEPPLRQRGRKDTPAPPVVPEEAVAASVDTCALLPTLWALRTPLSWKKSLLGPINTWLGFVIQPEGPIIQMAKEKHTRVTTILSQMTQGGCFHGQGS